MSKEGQEEQYSSNPEDQLPGTEQQANQQDVSQEQSPAIEESQVESEELLVEENEATKEGAPPSEEPPAWLAKMRYIESADESETREKTEIPEEELPEWLLSTTQDEFQTKGEIDKEQGSPEGEFPDWLQDNLEAVRETQEKEQDDEPEIAHEEKTKSEDMPGWLAELRDVETEEATAGLPKEGATDEELPSWLIESTRGMDDLDQKKSQDELPDWFVDNVSADTPSEGEITEGQSIADEELPDWLLDKVKTEIESQESLAELDADRVEEDIASSDEEHLSSLEQRFHEIQMESEAEVDVDEIGEELPIWLMEAASAETPPEVDLDDELDRQADELPEWILDIEKSVSEGEETPIEEGTTDTPKGSPAWLWEDDEDEGEEEPLADVRRALLDEETAKEEQSKTGIIASLAGLLGGSAILNKRKASEDLEKTSHEVQIAPDDDTVIGDTVTHPQASEGKGRESELEPDFDDDSAVEEIDLLEGEEPFDSQQEPAESYDEGLIDESLDDLEIERRLHLEEEEVDKLGETSLDEEEVSRLEEDSELSLEEESPDWLLEDEALERQDEELAALTPEEQLALAASVTALESQYQDERSDFETLEQEEDQIEELGEEYASEPGAESLDLLSSSQLERQELESEEGAETFDDFSDMRDVALDGYTESPVQPIPTGNRIQSWWDGLKPGDKKLLAGLGLLNITLLIVALAIIVISQPRTNQQQAIQPTSTMVWGMPSPVQVELPGGWVFELQRGSVQDGVWDPQQPEWLVGTEIRRLIALPWSKQLEAVVRSFEPDDPIELLMSNGDRLEYRVLLVQEVPVDLVDVFYSNQPSLVIVLAAQESETRWIAIAVP